MCSASILYIINSIILEVNYTLNLDIDIKIGKLGIPKDYKEACINELYKLGDNMNHQTNVKAIMTSYEIWNETDLFNPLLDRILYITNTLFPIEDNDWEYDLVNCWGAIYQKENYTVPHKHLPYYLSFVYYLQSTGNTPLIFNEGNKLEVTPKDDMLIVFPSYLVHSVPKHEHNIDRICLAGNLTLKYK